MVEAARQPDAKNCRSRECETDAKLPYAELCCSHRWPSRFTELALNGECSPRTVANESGQAAPFEGENAAAMAPSPRHGSGQATIGCVGHARLKPRPRG